MRNWLIKERKKQGLSQKALAIASGCSQQMISKAERGMDITVSYAKKIAEVLNLDWTKFYDERRTSP